MPWSMWDNILPVLNEVYRLQPERMIELGIGLGKYGTLCREALDGMHGRCGEEQWLRKIYGIEAFEPYRNPCWGAYDGVEIADFTAADVSGFDLVLMIDSFEHLEPRQGREFLAGLLERNRQVILSVPVGRSEQGSMYGNVHETHLAQFTGREFDRYNPSILHRGYCWVFSMRGNV